MDRRDEAASATSVKDVRRFTAEAVARLAVVDLRVLGEPGPGDYAIADELLGVAEALSPGDVEIVRRRAEAAWNAGDSLSVLRATRRIVELDPSDTVAQLRLISARVSALQSVEERLRVLGGFISDKGSRLDPSVRSRLALDAALLYREQGQQAEFIDALKQATALDSTNKDAALLALQQFVGSGASERDRVGHVELLVNLLLADPLDAKVHLMLRDELARAGAYEQASRFHAIGVAILNSAGDAADAGLVSEGLALRWYAAGPEGPLAEIARQLSIERDRILRQARGDGLAVMRPEDVRLAPSFEELRAMLLFSQGERGAAELARSIADMAATAQVFFDTMNDPARRGADVTEAQAKEYITLRKLALAAYRALTGVNAAEAQTTLTEILAELPADDPRRTRVDAWSMLAAGDAAGALARTRQIEDPLIWDRVCEARALDLLGRTDEAVGAYDATRLLEPLSPIAAWAWTRASALRTTAPAAEGQTSEIEAVARSVPPWVDTMLEAPRRFQLVMVDLDPQNAGPLERSSMVLTLRNLSPIPLGLGTGKPINTRFFLAPSIELGTRAIQSADTGEVMELDRRLRLMPRESMSVRVWPEIGLSGYVVERGLSEPSRTRWRVLQGFEFKPSGRREAGPGSLEAMSTSLSRAALPEARLAGGELAARLADRALPEGQVAALIVAARVMLANVASADVIAAPGAAEGAGATGAGGAALTSGSQAASGAGTAPPVTPVTPVTPSAPADLFAPVAPPTASGATPAEPKEPAFSFATSGPKPIAYAEGEAVARALIAAYPTWSPTLRQLAIATLPPGGEVALLKELDALMVADEDPSARLLATVSRIAAKDDAMLAKLVSDPDPRVARAAGLHAGRLDLDAYVYAKGGVPAELGGQVR